MPGPLQDAFDQEAGGGLAVGAGDRHHGELLRGGAEKAGREFGQGAAGGGDGDDDGVRGGRPLGHDGDRPAPDRVIDERVAVRGEALHGHEEAAGRDILRAVVDRGDVGTLTREAAHGCRLYGRNQARQFHPRPPLSRETLSFSGTLRGGTFR